MKRSANGQALRTGLRRPVVSPVFGLLFGLIVAGCAVPPPDPAPQAPAPAPAKETAVKADHTVYDVSETESILLVEVMRSGPLSRFGHNHVIGGAVLSGQLSLAAVPGEGSSGLPAGKLSDSEARLTVHLDRLRVDEKQWRLDAGEEFASVPSEEDIAGTRANMLGPKVLDVARFPVATAEVTGILGTLPDFSVLARITLKESTRSLPVPVHLEVASKRVTASGSFTLTQSDFGIEPFSVLLGAISVQDDLRIQYTIVATERP